MPAELYSIFYIGLIAASIRIIIFQSPLVGHFLEVCFTRTPMTSEDVRQWLMGRSMLLYRLWTCVYCQTFWTTLIATVLLWRSPFQGLAAYAIALIIANLTR